MNETNNNEGKKRIIRILKILKSDGNDNNKEIDNDDAQTSLNNLVDEREKPQIQSDESNFEDNSIPLIPNNKIEDESETPKSDQELSPLRKKKKYKHKRRSNFKFNRNNVSSDDGLDEESNSESDDDDHGSMGKLGAMNSYCDIKSLRENGILMPSGERGDVIKKDAKFGTDYVNYVVKHFEKFLNDKIMVFLFKVAGHSKKTIESLMYDMNTQFFHGSKGFVRLLSKRNEELKKEIKNRELKIHRNKLHDDAIRKNGMGISEDVGSQAGSQIQSKKVKLSSGIHAKTIASSATTLNLGFRTRERNNDFSDLGTKSKARERDVDKPKPKNKQKDQSSSSLTQYDEKAPKNGRQDNFKNITIASSDDEENQNSSDESIINTSDEEEEKDWRFKDRMNTSGLKSIPPILTPEIYNVESYETALARGKESFVSWLISIGKYDKNMESAIDRLFPDNDQINLSEWSLNSSVSGFIIFSPSLVTGIDDALSEIKMKLRDICPYEDINIINMKNMVSYYMIQFTQIVGYKVFQKSNMPIINPENNADMMIKSLNNILTIVTDIKNNNRIRTKISEEEAPIIIMSVTDRDYETSEVRKRIRKRINLPNTFRTMGWTQ